MATLITKNSSTASAVPAAGDLVKGELAVNVTDKKVYTKDNSAAVVKLVGSLGNQEANAVAVTGGTINGATIGATTPSTGAFTTASASSGFTGNLTGNVTGNVSGTAANVTGVVAIANGGTGLSALGTGVQSALGQAVTGSGSFVLSTSPSLTTPNLGTPSAAVLTNATGLPLTTGVTGTLGVANGGTGITAFGTGVATALGQNVTGSGGIVLATSPSLTTPNLGTPSAATLTNATGLPISTGVSGLGTGVATALGVAVGSAGAFVVNGGALGTPSSGTVTNLTGTASININGTVGATTPTTGAFTTLSASGNITVSGGTANGVAYLNGSKVLTTGSALTFDGTALGAARAIFTAADNAYAVAFNATTGNARMVPYDSTYGSSALVTYSAGYAGYGPFTVDALNHRWWVSGSEQMRLTSTGLGIGTSSPQRRIHGYIATGPVARMQTNGSNAAIEYVPGATDGTGTIFNWVVGAQYNIGNAFEITPSTAAGGLTFSNPALVVTSGGNVGIGTSSPGAKLDVNGITQSRGNIYGGVANTTANIIAYSNVANGGAGFSQFLFANTSTETRGYLTYTHASDALLIGTAGTTKATLDSSGNLGLGVTPSAWGSSGRALQISSVTSISQQGNGSANVMCNAYESAANAFSYVVSAGAMRYNQSASGGHSWHTAPSGTAGNAISFTQAMTLDANGNLGIGTTNPAAYAAKAMVVGSASSQNLLTIQDTGTSYGSNKYYQWFINSAGASAGWITHTEAQGIGIGSDSALLLYSGGATERARITSGGDLLVGTTTTGLTPASGFGFNASQYLSIGHANGVATGTEYISFAYNSTKIGSITQNGTTGVLYNITSDYRLKNVVGAVTGSGARIDALLPVDYTWKADGSAARGFLAHEFQAVYPNSVTGTKDAVDAEGKPVYQQMQASTTEVIADLVAEIKSLRARVAQLEAK